MACRAAYLGEADADAIRPGRKVLTEGNRKRHSRSHVDLGHV
jgi:hypothetical protein